MVETQQGKRGLCLDFGDLPVAIEREAESLLASLPQAALQTVVAAVREWSGSAPVTHIRAVADFEPEDPDWEQALIEIWVDTDDDQALDLWDELGSVLDKTIRSLSNIDRDKLDRGLSIQLAWPDGDD